MKFLTVADCHGKLSETSLKEQIGLANAINRTGYDAVLFLGDNNTDDIECVKDWLKANDITTPMYGVFGNHDSPYILGMNGIENIHGKVVEVGSIRIGSFGGCVIDFQMDGLNADGCSCSLHLDEDEEIKNGISSGTITVGTKLKRQKK